MRPSAIFLVQPFPTTLVLLSDESHYARSIRRISDFAASWYGPIMTSAEVIAELRKRAPEIRALGATSLYLFGSAARDEANEASDIDLFVDYDPDKFGFVELIRLRERLTEELGHAADLTTREGLHPLLRPAIEAEAIKVF